MSVENNSEYSDRHRRNQRLWGYFGIAAMSTGIVVTLGIMFGAGPDHHHDESPSAVNKEYSFTGETDNTGTEWVVGGLGIAATAGAGALIWPKVKEFMNTSLPDAQIVDGRDPDTDKHFRELVEPLRGTMSEECGW
jgi:hypothetical protein